MASDKGVPSEGPDERLVAARDSALTEGEKIVAHEEGDQGQGIVLTDSRVLVIRVGITATGTANGHVVGAFPFAEIDAVNVRTGPLGSVIQICVERRDAAPQPGTPDNVVVFTGSQRMKKCDAIAAKIESAIGKPVSRLEPATEQVTSDPLANAEANDEVSATPAESAVDKDQPPARSDAPSPPDLSRGGRVPRTLAEEIYAEMAETQSRSRAAVPAAEGADPALVELHSPQTPAQPVVEAAVEPADTDALEERRDASIVLGPNPNLPRPVRPARGADRVLVVFGGLIALLILGVAVMRPLSAPEPAPTVDASWSDLTRNVKLLSTQRNSVTAYERAVAAIAQSSERSLAVFEAALRSGNKASITSAARKDTTDDAWRKLNALNPPAGLAGAKEQVASGLFVAKTAVANASGAVQSSTAFSARQPLSRLSEARALIARGLGSIAKMRADLESEIESADAKKSRAK